MSDEQEDVVADLDDPTFDPDHSAIYGHLEVIDQAIAAIRRIVEPRR